MPIEDGGFSTIPSSHFGGIGLELMLPSLVPDGAPDLGSGCAQRYWWDGFDSEITVNGITEDKANRLQTSDQQSQGVKIVFKRRLVDRVLRLWTEMAHGRRFPRRNQIEPYMLGGDWANCLVITVRSPVQLSYFVAVGENLSFAHCPNDTLAGVLLSHLSQVLSERRCLMIEGRATLHGSGVLYRSGLFPLSEDDVTIDHVLGAANHRLLRENEELITPLIRTKWL